MVNIFELFICLASLGLSNAKEYDYKYPDDTLVPKISGVSAIGVENSDGFDYFVFSGNIDATKFSSNMMTISTDSVTFSSTSNYPADRSYYGMAYSLEINDYSTYTLAIVFGGIGSEGVIGDIWEYYIEKDSWRNIYLSLPEPSYDFAYASYYDSVEITTNIFILGGIDNFNNFVDSFYWCNIEEGYCDWINNFVDCTDIGLVGAQLVFNNDVLYLFSGYSYDEEGQIQNFVDLCTLDLLDSDPVWNKVTPNNEFEQYSHGGSCVYDNYIYFFFGSYKNDTSTIYSDKVYGLSLYNIEDGWSEIDFECPDDLVCARDSFGIACNDNIATIIGGKTDSGATNSYLTIDMISFNVSEYKYESNTPTPRAFATLTKSSTKIQLFGGLNREVIFDEVWEYEFVGKSNLGTWNLLSILGSSPKPRFGHAATTQGVFTIFIGGQTYNDIILSDIWLLNTLSNSWTEFIPSEYSDYQIPALTQSCAMLDLPKLYFIGGKDYSGATFDLWEYDLSTNNLALLRKKKSSDVPTFGHACQLIKSNGKVLIYTLYGFRNSFNELYCGIRQIDITDTKNIKVKTTKELPDSMPCRGNFGFAYDGKDMVIIGGERFPDVTMSDFWWIVFDEDYEYSEFLIISSDSGLPRLFNKPLSGSSVIAFSEYIIIFSGYYDGSFSIKSDMSSSIYTSNIEGITHCSAGFYKTDDGCKPCGASTYSPNPLEGCIKCPSGTSHNLQAASHISQCVPCSQGKYYDINASECVKCPDGSLCPVGSQEPLDQSVKIKKQQTQPSNFVKPSSGSSLIIIGSMLGGSILFYMMLFCSSLFIRVAVSVYDFFRPDHVTLVNEESLEEDQNKISFVGGFFTGLAIIVVIFNFVYLVVQYRLENENETRSLVPLSSLIQVQNYNDNHLTIDISMYSFRGNCSQSSELSSNFFNTSYAEIYEEFIGENATLCTHIIDIDFNELFTLNAYIEFSFLGYTSDIALTVSGASGNPGALSSFTEVLESTDGDVLIGIEPSNFAISLIPAYYSYKGYFGDPAESLGFRLGAYGSPITGTVRPIENIFLSTGFKVRAQFILSEFGITTYKYQQVDPISFILALLATAPGLISSFRLLLITYEKVYYKMKKIPTKVKGTSVQEQYNRKKNKSCSSITPVNITMKENN